MGRLTMLLCLMLGVGVRWPAEPTGLRRSACAVSPAVAGHAAPAPALDLAHLPATSPIRPPALAYSPPAAYASVMRLAGFVLAAPVIAPTPRTFYATTQPVAGADGSIAKPLDLPRIWKLYHWPDVVLLHGGETFHGLNPPMSGANIGAYNGNAYVDAPNPVFLFHASGSFDIGGQPGLEPAAAKIYFVDSTRDPSKPGFVVHAGGVGFAEVASDSATVHLHDSTFEFFGYGIDLENMSAQHGTVIDHCTLRHIYSSPDSKGNGMRSEAIYAEGQYDSTIQNCLFDHCGYRDPQFKTATTQDWSIYWHGPSTDGKANGPLNCKYNNFVDCAAGPTTNTGGVIDSCRIIRCFNQTAGVPGFMSGDNCTFTHNVVEGSYFNFIGRSMTIIDNTFADPITSFSINEDVPAGQPNNYRVGCTVDIERNAALNSAGPVVRRTNDGGGVVIEKDNLPVPKPN